MTPAAIAGALLDLAAMWSQGVMTGVGVAIGVLVVVAALRAVGRLDG